MNLYHQVRLSQSSLGIWVRVKNIRRRVKAFRETWRQEHWCGNSKVVDGVEKQCDHICERDHERDYREGCKGTVLRIWENKAGFYTHGLSNKTDKRNSVCYL